MQGKTYTDEPQADQIQCKEMGWQIYYEVFDRWSSCPGWGCELAPFVAGSHLELDGCVLDWPNQEEREVKTHVEESP